MSEPLVSILIPAYNGERFLKPALRSALTQSHRNIEVLVGDDGSTDGTPTILADVAAQDSRVQIIRHDPNVGALENPRRLLEAAQGEYVKYLMHDDVLGTDCVRTLVRGMQAHPEASMAFSHRVLIDGDGRRIPGHEYKKLATKAGLIDGRRLGDEVLLSCTNVIGEPTTVLFRRADVDPANLWIIDGRTVDILNDVQLWLFLLARGPAFYTPESLSRFRHHAGQNSYNPRYVGRAERDWSRLVDWGARNGFLQGEGEEGRAQARALLVAATRVDQMIGGSDYGAALEAVFLSTARLVALTRSSARPTGGLPERAHDPATLDLFPQELDVWTREYDFALAAPGLERAEVDATVQALREVLGAGVAKRALVAAPPSVLTEVAALLESALAQGTDIDVELVPTDDPATLLDGTWLAVAPHGATWHDGRSLAIWRFAVGGMS